VKTGLKKKSKKKKKVPEFEEAEVETPATPEVESVPATQPAGAEDAEEDPAALFDSLKKKKKKKPKAEVNY
jgi:hypothetical protein